MSREFLNKESSSEVLRKWVTQANYEVLPTEKALDLVDIIPSTGSTRVTCRPTGIEDTIKFVEIMAERGNHKIVPNIGARRIIDESHFDSIFQRLKIIGTQKIFVIGGDGKPFGNKYINAECVLLDIYHKGLRFEEIGIAGYPEGNTLISENQIDLILRKQALSEAMNTKMEIVTQLCFDTDIIMNWVYKLRQGGVYLPVKIGVPGCLSLDTLLKAMAMSGVKDALSLLKSKPKLVKSLTGASFTGFSPGELIKDLVDKNDPTLEVSGISVFTFGNITKSVKHLSELK